jgi:hypothetical protein
MATHVHQRIFHERIVWWTWKCLALFRWLETYQLFTHQSMMINVWSENVPSDDHYECDLTWFFTSTILFNMSSMARFVIIYRNELFSERCFLRMFQLAHGSSNNHVQLKHRSSFPFLIIVMNTLKTCTAIHRSKMKRIENRRPTNFSVCSIVMYEKEMHGNR